MKKQTLLLRCIIGMILFLFTAGIQVVEAQSNNAKMRDFFSDSNNQAYMLISTLAHPSNVFTSGNCYVSGDYVNVTINSDGFFRTNSYTMRVKMHFNGAFFDSLEWDDTDWAEAFMATNVFKNIVIDFWRHFSPETIGKIENTFGSLKTINTKHMCLAVLTALYWKYQANSSSSISTRSVSPLRINMTGRIGNALESKCNMSYNQQTDTGSFSYELSGNTVRRTLKMISYDRYTNTLILKEYTTKGEVVGVFSGKLEDGFYEGYFTNTNNGVSIRFSLVD